MLKKMGDRVKGREKRRKKIEELYWIMWSNMVYLLCVLKET